MIYTYHVARRDAKMQKGKKKPMTDKEKDAMLRKSLPFVLGCDMNSNPSSAALKVFMGKDCLSATEAWYRPAEVATEFYDHYRKIETEFKKLMGKNKLLPLLNTLKSAYKDCTYSHGNHTSRVATCYSDKCNGMFDHIIFNDEHLKVTQILEIPEERFLAPS